MHLGAITATLNSIIIYSRTGYVPVTQKTKKFAKPTKMC